MVPSLELLVHCARNARAHNFIELRKVIIMVREVVFIHKSRAFIGMVFIFFSHLTVKRETERLELKM